LSFILRADAAK